MAADARPPGGFLAQFKHGALERIDVDVLVEHYCRSRSRDLDVSPVTAGARHEHRANAPVIGLRFFVQSGHVPVNARRLLQKGRKTITGCPKSDDLHKAGAL